MNYSLEDNVVVITGGAGFMGIQHAEAVAEIGGIPILADINIPSAKRTAVKIEKKFKVTCLGLRVDVTSSEDVENLRDYLIKRFSRIDVLINNAANNPDVRKSDKKEFSRVENFSSEKWNNDLSVGLTGAFLSSKILGYEMAKKGKGVILNIASDLGIIAPDQRIYKKESLSDSNQPVKPVTYSVIKHAIIGLTRYFATYWCDKGVRVNAFCPGGVYDGQPEEFTSRLANLIPLGRMANPDEYKGAIQFLCSDASSYMTGAVLVCDGGRSAW